MLPFQLIFKNKLRESKWFFLCSFVCTSDSNRVDYSLSKMKSWIGNILIIQKYALNNFSAICPELFWTRNLKCKFIFAKTREALLMMIFEAIFNYHKNQAVPFGHYVLGVGDSLMTSCAGWLFGSCNLIFYSWLVLKSTEYQAAKIQ